MPWYGVPTNHAVLTISFTVIGLVMWAMRSISGSSPEVDLAVVFVATAIGFSINMALAALTVSLRTGRMATTALAIGVKDMTLIYGAETSLAWIIAQAYVLVAWWSPILFVVADTVAGRSLHRHRAGWQVRHHQITELPNGVALRDHVRGLRRSSPSGMCVFYIDLDGFKAINDDHGHLVGDDVLRIVGQRLQNAAREGDFVAHLHGDEFVVLARDVADDPAARAIAARLVAVIEPSITHPVGELLVSATVGHHLAVDLSGLGEAIRDADRRMAEAKSSKAHATGRERRRD
jgi:diguanylate cyclase (GGDEF)-like protein